MTDWAGLTTAAFSAIATGLAAIATWRAPLAAAKLAEDLRRISEKDEIRRSQKMELFSTLMQERAAIYSDEGVRALNLIDVVFSDSKSVREAWAELFQAFDQQHQVPRHAQQERLRKLLATIAHDIGLGGQFGADDFARFYEPEAQSQNKFIQQMERQEKLKNLAAANQPASNAATQQNSGWPPTPTPTPKPTPG